MNFILPWYEEVLKEYLDRAIVEKEAIILSPFVRLILVVAVSLLSLI